MHAGSLLNKTLFYLFIFICPPVCLVFILGCGAAIQGACLAVTGNWGFLLKGT